MSPFAGWEMPIQFGGLVNEHQAVRNQAGLFDISHMGIYYIEGTNPKDALQALVPSDLYRIGEGEACYTVLLNDKGGILDDVIIYDLGSKNEREQKLLIVINAACNIHDLSWLKKNLEPKNIKISDAKKNGIFMALQGPNAEQILEQYCEGSIKSIPKFGHRNLQLNFNNISCPVFLSRTGYTGEDGFEILLEAENGKFLWQKLLKDGITPCGLGARDTLRLEAAMHLYGNDMNSKTTPFEAGLGWLVHLEMPSQFIGRDVLEKQAKEGIHKRLVGLTLQGRAIARKGYQVFHEESLVGQITSGTWSPTLNQAIALAYIPKELSTVGNALLIDIRGVKHPATIVKRPFYRRGVTT